MDALSPWAARPFQLNIHSQTETGPWQPETACWHACYIMPCLAESFYARSITIQEIYTISDDF